MQVSLFKNNFQPYNEQAKIKKAQVNSNLSFSGFPEYLANKVPDSFLKNKGFHNFLKLAEDNATLFEDVVTLILGITLRPASILAIPGAKKEDKNYAAAKSIASVVLGFGMTALVYIPLARHMKKLGNTAVKNASKSCSFPYPANSPQFASFNYLINYGSSFIAAPIQTILLFKAIPPIVNKFFSKSSNKIDNRQTLPDKLSKESNLLSANYQQELFKDFMKGNKQ